MSLAPRTARVYLRTSMRAIIARINIQNQAIMRRAMSSSTEGHSPKSSGDMPWIVGSAVVFVPLTLYLLRPVDKPAHEHEHGDAHRSNEEHEKHESPSNNEDMTDDGGAQVSTEGLVRDSSLLRYAT